MLIISVRDNEPYRWKEMQKIKAKAEKNKGDGRYNERVRAK